ncbi:hypothetical protein [Mycolicibacter algericus]|uniref:Uncharacterized protein n=2 Tax=Mycolicibacter algericus TaxID=1288388 RepID=A0A7I9Y3Z5_MYCAL|nr:hypothetical protein [Mycolicibacter algericus]OQZ96924.1 hypothetical protein BST10_10125 [Mycolicibacter algericus DSM 45454]GFG83380.1 hypothetical protein MALGJ_00560 [Mycolicibacter algericus]
MDPTRIVVVVAIALVALSIGLVVAGVAVLAGAGWALVAAGGLLGGSTVGAAWVLLREVGAPS